MTNYSGLVPKPKSLEETFCAFAVSMMKLYDLREKRVAISQEIEAKRNSLGDTISVGTAEYLHSKKNMLAQIESQSRTLELEHSNLTKVIKEAFSTIGEGKSIRVAVPATEMMNGPKLDYNFRLENDKIVMEKL